MTPTFRCAGCGSLAAMALLVGCGGATLAPDGGSPPDALLDAASSVTPDGGGSSADAGMHALVPVTLQLEVLLANNYPAQLHPLFRADLSSGSQLARLRLFARFCADAACAAPLALVPVEVPGSTSSGDYVFSTAGVSGAGFAKAVTVREAPLGATYLQLIGDTQLSRERGLGACDSLAHCPGDLDVVSVSGFQLAVNNDGSANQPPSAAIPVSIERAGAPVTLPDTVYLGHLHFERGPLEAAAPSDPGRLLVAVSNAQDTHRNQIGLISLADASAHPGALAPESFLLQDGAADYAGDVCGMIRGGDTLFVMGLDAQGASVFALDSATGTQRSATPLARIPASNPDDPETFPHPCRGVYVEREGRRLLYMIEFAGAGSRTSSHPYPLYQVDLATGEVGYPPIEGGTSLALRAIVADGQARVFVVDMSYSVDAASRTVTTNRIAQVLGDLGSGGDMPLSTFGAITDLTSDERCESTAHWPSGAAVVALGGVERLLLGHDSGVAVFSLPELTKVFDLSLRGHGRLFSQLAFVPERSRVYALPQCKALNADARFRLPYGAGTEAADQNLVAVLDASGAELAVAATTLDIDADGVLDHGLDLDFYQLKTFIRAHGSTLPIPPVVYTGPQLAVGRSLLFVRGSGIQGNGSDVISSSGLGQAQDVAFFNLHSGHGVVLGDYIPWLHGLSAMAGTGRAIWGYDVRPGRESSVGWIEYLP